MLIKYSCVGEWRALKDESTREKSQPNLKPAKNRPAAVSIQQARPTQTLCAKVSLGKLEGGKQFILRAQLRMVWVTTRFPTLMWPLSPY